MLIIIELLFIALLAVILFMIYKNDRSHSRSHAPRARVEECWGVRERRKYARFKKILDVTYSISRRHHLKNTAKTIDISRGGMKLLIDEKLTMGTIMDIKVILPPHNKTAEIEGEVVWSEDLDGHDESGRRFFHAGIKFSAVKEPHEGILAQYISSIAMEVAE